MVQFLNTATAYSEIENIIGRAESKLVLISPYIQIPKLLFERLYHASEKRSINITLVCRKKDLKRDEYKVLNKISRLEILDLPNLHAKCFYNEKSMVITSLNLYEYSQINNREMGILITHEKEPEAFTDAVNEAEFIMQTAFLIKVNKTLARLNRHHVKVQYVLNSDIGAGLRKAFPTFSKLFSKKKIVVD